MSLHDIIEKIRAKYVLSDLHADYLAFLVSAKNEFDLLHKRINELEEKIKEEVKPIVPKK